MKPITINVSEPVYRAFQEFAQRKDRTTSELIRQAMEEFCQHHMVRKTTLRSRKPQSVGGPIRPVTPQDDLLEEMLHDTRD